MGVKYERLITRLKAAKTQEDIDRVVQAGRTALNDEEFQSFTRCVLNRRSQCRAAVRGLPPQRITYERRQPHE